MEKRLFEIPAFMKKMLDNGWLGSKAKQGFYYKKGKDILEIDPETLTYQPRKRLSSPSINLSKSEKDLSKRMKTLLYSDDDAGKLLWNIITPVLVYSAQLLGEIADTIVDIDRAMKWGFGWEQGPFEIWDAIGLERSLPKMTESNLEIPQWIKDMIGEWSPIFLSRRRW